MFGEHDIEAYWLGNSLGFIYCGGVLFFLGSWIDFCKVLAVY